MPYMYSCKIYHIKKASILIAALFTIAIIFAQKPPETSKEIPKDEFVMPGNRTAVSEALEEIKEKIKEHDLKVKVLKKYSNALETYKSKITNYESKAIEQALTSIEAGIKVNNKDEIYSSEEDIFNSLDDLEFYLGISPFDNPEDNSSALSFRKSLNEIKKVLDNELLSQLSNNHGNGNNKTVIDTKDKLEKIRTLLNPKAIDNVKKQLIEAISNESLRVKKSIEESENQLKQAKVNKIKLLEKLNEQATQINDLAIKLGLPLFCLTILLLFLGPKIIKLSKNGHNIEPSDETSQNVLLEISTVLLLTMSILILGLSGKIASDVLGTLIGGISGYVLNRIRAGARS